MPRSEQGVDRQRYQLIPRVLIFLRRSGSVLLIKGAPTKRLWANKYNGVGGHVEPGEDILAAARRELLEETGLSAVLWLCGTVVVETGQNPGICLFVFTGECNAGQPRPSEEGVLEWVPLVKIPELPVVEDLPVLLDRVFSMKRGEPPFSAHSSYDRQERLVVQFAD
ncbi:MAG: NUDIX domain-containing protein [Anaerolineales bacterium]|jgi:8-oxo-dGTP diphosphatase